MITVNLETKTARNGKKFLIKNGIPVTGYQISDKPVTFSDIERLYQIYKTSVPYNDTDTSRYFYAPNSDAMTTRQLITGTNRQSAREKLEMTILEGVLNHTLIWPDNTLWFWQSPNDPDLILLKQWIVSP